MTNREQAVNELREITARLDTQSGSTLETVNEVDRSIRQLIEYLPIRRFRIVSDILFCHQNVFVAGDAESRAITAAIDAPHGLGILIWTNASVLDEGLAGNPTTRFVPLQAVPGELRKCVIPLIPSLVRSFIECLPRQSDNGR